MEPNTHAADEKPKGEENPLPLSEVTHVNPQVGDVNPITPLPAQQNLAAQNPQEQAQGCGKKNNEPFRVAIVENNELSIFEKKTVLLGKLGLVIAGVSLLAACLAAFLIFQQFKEMAAQTNLLNIQIRQAREDSANSSVATAKQLEALQGQLDAARHSAGIAAQQLDLTDRAWIEASDLSPLVDSSVPALQIIRFNGTGPHPIKWQILVEFRGNATNVGRSPALNAVTYYEVYLLPNERITTGTVPDEEKRFCNYELNFHKTPNRTGLAVYPTKDMEIGGGASGAISPNQVHHLAPFPGGEYVSPILIGCVDYQFQTSSRRHQTRFAYRIEHSTAGSTGQFFRLGELVPGEGLLLTRLHEADYAD